MANLMFWLTALIIAISLIGIGFILLRKKSYSITTAIITFTATIFGIVSALTGYTLSDMFNINNQRLELSERIESVSQELKNSVSELNAIQLELESRIEFVDNLKKEAENAEAMIDLSQEQVEAIRATLNAELTRGEKKNFWTTTGLSFFFMCLGSVVTLLIDKLRGKQKENKITVKK